MEISDMDMINLSAQKPFIFMNLLGSFKKSDTGHPLRNAEVCLISTSDNISSNELCVPIPGYVCFIFNICRTFGELKSILVQKDFLSTDRADFSQNIKTF